jgi:hypothetical protein
MNTLSNDKQATVQDVAISLAERDGWYYDKHLPSETVRMRKGYTEYLLIDLFGNETYIEARTLFSE